MWIALIAPALADEPAFVVEITGARNDTGLVACQIFTSAEGFPDDTAHAVTTAIAPIAEGRAACAFATVPSGPFAVAVMHDEDQDLALDRNFLGIPSEGYAFTNGALGWLGTPPAFEAAVVRPAAGARQSVALVY